jgi:hypothetical protein
MLSRTLARGAARALSPLPARGERVPRTKGPRRVRGKPERVTYSLSLSVSSRRITVNTPSRLVKTSEFQKRRTRYPCPVMCACRTASRALSACWPPSSSMANFARRQRKSTMYGPIGAWRTNLKLTNRRSRSRYHILPSASVICRRRRLAIPTVLGSGPRMAATPHPPRSLRSFGTLSP